MTNPLDKAISYAQSLSGFAQAVREAEDFDTFVAEHHHGVGRHLRNKLKLWDYKSKWAKYFYSEYGIWHADDMSSIIMALAYCDHKGQEFNLPLEVTITHNYWKAEYQKRYDNALERIMNRVDKKIQHYKQTSTPYINHSIEMNSYLVNNKDGKIVKITEGRIDQ